MLGDSLTMNIKKGDITKEKVDCISNIIIITLFIANAANTKLEHGGGVAGAISKNGGPQI
jgi:O-acetyl-ADP-ribose deacetylase (regulator of RNase III)